MILPEINYIEEFNLEGNTVLSTKTFKISLEDKRITEKIDDEVALLQSMYLNLLTERYSYEIFDRDYGLETSDLIGESIDYIKAVLPQRIRECLLIDDRVISVDRVDVYQGNTSYDVIVDVYVSTIYSETTDLRLALNLENRTNGEDWNG